MSQPVHEYCMQALNWKIYPFLTLLSEGELKKFSSCEEISESEGNIINSDTEWEVTGKYFLCAKPSQQRESNH